MSPEWVGAVGVLAGSLLTGLISIIISTTQLKHERGRILLQKKISDEKEKSSKYEARREELFDLIQKIVFELSLTQFTVLRDKEITHSDFIEYYNRIFAMTFRSRLLVYLYFPGLIKEVEDINRLIHSIWGIQNNYFGDSCDNKQNQDLLLRDFINVSEEFSKCCLRIMNLVSDCHP